MNRELMQKTAIRLTAIRTKIIRRQPFFGRLLLHLPFGFADCETAYTDMRKIVVSPDFADMLDDDELTFLVLHELYHCVLKHCTRGKDKLHLLYNISCDIVVNSLILESMGHDNFMVDGESVMHLAPDGREGRDYNAEEIYQMLMDKSVEELAKIYGNGTLDAHSVWEQVCTDSLLEEIWNRNIAEASKRTGYGTGIPEGIKRIVEKISRSSKINWKQLLHDFIQHDCSDFYFNPPDRRFPGDIIMPSFRTDLEDQDIVQDLWFLVDTSASVTDNLLAEAMGEIGDAIQQIGNLSGSISFFDCKVTEPIPFESVEDLTSIEPVGGGGTDFHAIFRALPEYYNEELPRGIIIITDGEAMFPKEEALAVPVFWLIIESDIEPPWGQTVHIYSN